MIETPKNEQKIREFLDAFGRLSPDEKLSFLAEIDKTLAGKDEKERELFLSLIKAARQGKSAAETISEMRKS